MNREKELAKNTLIISIGNICTKLVTFFLLPLYTSLLSTSEYGTVDLLNTLVSLMLPLVTFQIENAVFRELVESRKNDNNDLTRKIISNSINFVLYQIIIYFLFFVIISFFINNRYKYFMCINVIAFIINSLFLQIARGIGDNKNYAVGSFISATSTVLLNVVFLVIFKLKVNGMLWATFFGQIIGASYLLIKLKLYKYIKIGLYDKSVIKKLLKYSVPLIPNAISWWIFNSSDRVIVNIFLGISYTGVLSASYKFSSAYIVVYNIFHLGWAESISLHINENDISKYFNNMFNILVKFFTSAGILAISIMPFVWPLMVNNNYSEGYGLVPFLLLAAIFQTIAGMTSVVYLGKKDTKAIAVTSILAASINIFSHLILIKFTGLYAAAISTLLSFFIMATYRIIDVSRKYFKININFKYWLYTFLILVITLIFYYLNNKLSFIGSIICIIYFIFTNFKSISQLKNVLRKRG